MGVGVRVPVSVAVFALVEALVAFLALYFAVLVRFQAPFSRLQLLEAELGPLWPRALFFSLIVVIALMAFGLYSPRQRPQRPQLPDVLVRVVAALLVAACAVAALFLSCAQPEAVARSRGDRCDRGRRRRVARSSRVALVVNQKIWLMTL